MADYIDRIALRDVLYEAEAITMKGLRILNQFPSADVVEVVRCKDCRYYPTGTDNEEDQGFGLQWPFGELYKCPFMCDDGWYSRKPKPDFFCANGERG